ncbi:MAG: choice-of-anchor D domain-containing protein [Ignavibacteriales bacterium]|nr:choice-of-anchor D domain-containing protein [Ignavibacteriales bacterium]
MGIDNQNTSSHVVNIYNNMITLQGPAAASATNCKIYGIRTTSSSTTNIYFNTIYIPEMTNMTTFGSSYIAGIAFATAATTEASPTGTVTATNNIIISDETSMKTWGIRRVGTGGTFTSNYNDIYYNAANTSGYVGYYNATDYQTFANWKTASSQDANSINSSLTFTSTTDLHIDAGTEYASLPVVSSAGTAITGYSTDIDGETRDASTPDIGADEFKVSRTLTTTGTLPSSADYGTVTVNGTGITTTLGGATAVSSAFTMTNGTLDCGANVISGAGTFTLASGTTLKSGHASGTGGNISVAGTITLNSGANYEFNGSAAQVTGSLLPSALNNLTLNNTNGVTLSNNLTVNGTLTFTAGKLTGGANTLTLGSAASVSGAGSGKFVDGLVSAPVAATSQTSWPIGQGSDYLPSKMYVNSVSGSGGILFQVLDKGSDTPAGSTSSFSPVLTRYYRASLGTGVTSFTADSLTLSYASSDVSAGFDETTFLVYRWTGSAWSKATINSIDTTANTITIAGVSAVGDFIITGPSAIFSANKTSIAFGAIGIDDSKKDSVDVSNSGTASLIITSATANDASYAVEPSSATIAAGANAWFTVTYHPTASGTNNAKVSFVHNGSTSPDSVSLTGSAEYPSFAFGTTLVDFGDAAINATKTDSVVVTNASTAATLTVSAIASTNAKFTVAPSSASIAPSDSQTFTISFTPTDGSLQSGWLVFTNNSQKGSDSLSVSGKGAVPGFSASKRNFDFGNVRIAHIKSDSLLLKNTSISAMSIDSVVAQTSVFTVSPSSHVIAANDSVWFTVDFQPVAMGNVADTIVFYHNATTLQDTILVKGTGTIPIFAAGRKSIDFGTRKLNESAADSFYVRNGGNEALAISSVTVSDTLNEFVVSPAEATVQPGDSAKFSVSFNSLKLGSKAVEVIFAHDGSSASDTVKLSALVAQGVFGVNTDLLAFGSVAKDSSMVDSVSVSNSGNVVLSVDSVRSSSSEFLVSPTAGTVGVSETATFQVTFAPKSAGSKNALLVFYHDGVSSRDTVKLTGTATAPTVSVTPLAINFGSLLVGSPPKSDTVSVANNGTATLVISSVASTDAHFGVSPTSANIAAGASKKFALAFSADSAKSYTGLLIITSNTAKGKDTVALSGKGLTVISISQARLAANGTEVVLEGIVTRAKGSYTYMQDTSAGIVIYQSSGSLKDSIASGGVKPGDKLHIQGKTSEYNSLKEIAAADLISWSAISKNNPIPTPPILTLKQLATNGEKYEAMVVKVLGATVLPGTDTVYAAAKTYSITDASDTSKAVALRIPNATDSDVDGTRIIKVITFTGVVGQFSSSNPAAGYQLMAIFPTDVTDNALDVKTPFTGIPLTFELYNNYPNPFNPTTTIQYGLPSASRVTLKIYSLLGQEISTLVDGLQPAGYHQALWEGRHQNGAPVASGVYFYRIVAEPNEQGGKPFVKVMKMLLMK